jgi:uncharacterized protein (UPF0548 family)
MRRLELVVTSGIWGLSNVIKKIAINRVLDLFHNWLFVYGRLEGRSPNGEEERAK